MKKIIISTFALSAVVLSVWLYSGYLTEKSTSGLVDIDQAQMLEEVEADLAVLIDIRTDEEYQAGSIPGAIHMPIDEIVDDLSLLERFGQKNIILYCHSGGRVKRLTDFVRSKGHSSSNQLTHLKGDYSGWVDAGLAVNN